jgi:recombination protein RecT
MGETKAKVNMSENKILTQTPVKRDIRALLASEDVRAKIAEVLPSTLTAERMTRVMLATVNRTPKLTECTPASLLDALMRCSQVGLEPDGYHAHLIPFGNQVQVIYDYKGLLALIRRNGLDGVAFLVHQEDTFEFLPDDGTGKTSVHHAIDVRKDRGPILGCYARAQEVGKPADYEWMSVGEIETTRKQSRAANNGPWVTHWSEMARKTVIRRMCKRLPIRQEDRAALMQDDDTPLALGQTVKPVFKSRALLETGGLGEEDFAPVVRQRTPTGDSAAAMVAETAAMVAETANVPPPVERKIEAAAATPTVPAHTLQRQVEALFVGAGATFNDLVAVVGGAGGPLPHADTWASVEDITKEDCAFLLKSPKGLVQGFQHVAAERQAKTKKGELLI